jgi:hypothetical protein
MKLIFIGLGAVLAALIGTWWFHCGPGFDGTVAALKLDDGSEYLVTQQFNGLSEPYFVGFYQKLPDGRWGWNYLSHQSTRWQNAELTYDKNADAVRLTKDGVLTAVLDRQRRTFIYHSKSGSSECVAPQHDFDEPDFTRARMKP